MMMETADAEYIWLPLDDASPAADNDNEEGAQTPPLPLGLVTGVNTPAPALLMVHADHLGRPVRLTDAARATVWSAAYDPFGQPWQITGTVEQNLRFPGQYFLIETGLAYNWHRFYDPATGRYTQPDPLRFVDGPSVYGYATASPMMRVDPEGLSCLPLAQGGGCGLYTPPPILGGGGGGGRGGGAAYPPASLVCSNPFPPGFWPADKGAEEWGRRNGVGAREGKRRFHQEKQKDKGKGKDNYGVNPGTGEISNPDGDIIGNLDGN